MLHTNFLKRLAQAAEVRLLFIVLMLGSFVLNVILVTTVAIWPKEQRTVILPPVVQKSFWVDGNNIAPEYIEMMGAYVLQLMLNVTPGSVKYQTEMLLGITDPRIHPVIKKLSLSTAARLTRDGVSTVFTPESVYTDSKTPNRMAWGGSLITLMTDKRVSELRKYYMVEFATVAGRTVLSRFEETSEASPLNPIPKTDDSQD